MTSSIPLSHALGTNDTYNPSACPSLRSSDPGPDIDVVEESPEKGDGINYIYFFVLEFWDFKILSHVYKNPPVLECIT